MNLKVDYFIVGLGLAGSVLAWELLNRGKKIIVFDCPEKNQASSVAAGLYNPVTGKSLTPTWMADVLFPSMEKFYAAAEKKLNKKFLHQLPIYRPFISQDEKELWRKRLGLNNLEKFVGAIHDNPTFDDQVRNPFGGIEIAHSGYLNVASWIEAIREHLISLNVYRETELLDENLKIGETVEFDGMNADKIIFCNGIHALKNQWFSKLPLLPLKGEVLNVRMELDLKRIYNRGVYIVPSGEENVYTVGSTYVRPPFDDGLSTEALDDLKNKLAELILCPFETVHQKWGIRPTTPDRRPILGVRQDQKNLVIFNGLGTKGVSLAPYFAHHLSDWLEGGGDLISEVNIYRFKALYSS